MMPQDPGSEGFFSWLKRSVLIVVLLMVGTIGFFFLTPFLVVLLWQAGLLSDGNAEYAFSIIYTPLAWLGLLEIPLLDHPI